MCARRNWNHPKIQRPRTNERTNEHDSPTLANVLIIFRKKTTFQVFVDVVVTPGGHGRVVFTMLGGVTFFQNVIGHIRWNRLTTNTVMRHDYRFASSNAFRGTKRCFAVTGATAMLRT